MRAVLFFATVLFLILFGAYLAVELSPAEVFGGADRVRIVSERIEKVGATAWTFGRPILQLIVVVLIVQAVLAKAGLQLNLREIKGLSDTRSLLALTVVATFCLAALSGGPGMEVLKDVTLVVVGFYFGEMSKKGIEGDKPAGK